jgi:hypothetical protein
METVSGSVGRPAAILRVAMPEFRDGMVRHQGGDIDGKLHRKANVSDDV